jgi:hypothetical protein
MAPGKGTCPYCSVGYQQYKTQQLTAYQYKNHEVRLTIHSGSAGLTVNGSPVSGLSCTSYSNVRSCTFVATSNGTFNAIVYGAPGPATYSLEYFWDD